MKNVRVARRYAAALMSLGEELQLVDTFSSDLALVGRVLQSARELRLLLRSPIISPGKKKAVFDEVFQAHIGKETMEFLILLIRKRREELLPDVITQFQALRDELQGVMTVDVISSTQLRAEQTGELKDRLDERTRKKVHLSVTVDPSLLGGLVVRIGDTVLDGSIRRQLERLRERFVEGEVLSH